MKPNHGGYHVFNCIHMFRFRIIWFHGGSFRKPWNKDPVIKPHRLVSGCFFLNSWLIWISIKRLWDGNQFIIAVHSHCKLKESQQCHRKLLKVVAGVSMQTPRVFLSRKYGDLLGGLCKTHWTYWRHKIGFPLFIYYRCWAPRCHKMPLSCISQVTLSPIST